MPSISLFFERLSHLSGILMFFFIPGLILLISGLRIWISKSIFLFANKRSMQGWERPKLVKGQKALFWAKLYLITGIIFLITCLLIALSVF